MSRALAFVLLATACGPVAAQDIRVLVDRPQQPWEGAGATFELFLNNHVSRSAEDQDEAVQLIARDLNMGFLQAYPEGDRTEQSDPAYFDRRADYVRAARRYRPEIQFSLATNQFPTALRQDTTINGNPYKILNTEDPQIYAKLADWYFTLFQAFDRRGARVDILNVVNEPDLNACPPTQPLQCRPYHYGYGRNPMKGSAEIFARAVPLFKAKFADPALNPTGMRVPVIMGPSTFAPGGTPEGGALAFVRYYKQTRPEAWAQIDWVATHQYQNGVRGDLFQALQQEAGGKPLVQSETHASRDFGPATLADPLRTSLSLAQLFGAAVNFGARSWWYFNTVYPDAYTAAGLLRVPNQADAPGPEASPVPYKQYFVYRQLTSAQPLGADVLDYTASAGRRADVVAFRKAGENVLYVTVTNTEAGTKRISLDAADAAGVRVLTRYSVRTTDATRNDEVTADVALPTGTTAISVDLGPYSVHTFTVAMAPVGGTAAGGGPEAGTFALAQNAPNPARGTTTLAFTLARDADDAELAVFDVLGKQVATVASGPQRGRAGRDAAPRCRPLTSPPAHSCGSRLFSWRSSPASSRRVRSRSVPSTCAWSTSRHPWGSTWRSRG